MDRTEFYLVINYFLIKVLMPMEVRNDMDFTFEEASSSFLAVKKCDSEANMTVHCRQ